MWELWGVEISAFPLTWHIAYTTACCYRTSREVQTWRNYLSRGGVVNFVAKFVAMRRKILTTQSDSPNPKIKG